MDVLSIIESKFEVMDKLIAAYEAIRKDDLVIETSCSFEV